MASEQPLATSVVTFRVEHWLDPLQAPCQSLQKVALGGLVWPGHPSAWSGGDPTCSWPAPWRRPLGKVGGHDIPPVGAEGLLGPMLPGGALLAGTHIRPAEPSAPPNLLKEPQAERKAPGGGAPSRGFVWEAVPDDPWWWKGLWVTTLQSSFCPKLAPASPLLPRG